MADRVSDERLAELAEAAWVGHEASMMAAELLALRPREAALVRLLAEVVRVHDAGRGGLADAMDKARAALAPTEGQPAALGPATAAGAPRDEIDRIREEFHGIDKLRGAAGALAGGEARDGELSLFLTVPNAACSKCWAGKHEECSNPTKPPLPDDAERGDRRLCPCRTAACGWRALKIQPLETQS